MSPEPAALGGASRHKGQVNNFTDMNPDEETIKDLNSFRYHHSLTCGHVVRATDGNCASNCLVDDMVNDVKESLPFTCYACFGALASLAVGNETARDSAPGVMHFLLNNDRASLTDRSKCCGSQGAQYMLRSTRQRRERAPDPPKGKRKVVTDPEEGSSSKRTRLPASGSTMSLSLRPRAPSEPFPPSEPVPSSSQRQLRPRAPAEPVPSSSQRQLRPRAPAEPLGRKKLARWPKASKNVLAPTITDVGKKRVSVSQRVWENYGEASNVASLMTSLEQLGTKTEGTEHDTLTVSAGQDKGNVRKRAVRPKPSAPVVENITDYFPNIERDESPPPFIKSESDDEDDGVLNAPGSTTVPELHDTLHPDILVLDPQLKLEEAELSPLRSEELASSLFAPSTYQAGQSVHHIKSEYPDLAHPYYKEDVTQPTLSLFSGFGTEGAPYFKKEDYAHDGFYVKKEFQVDAANGDTPNVIPHITQEECEGAPAYIKQEWELELDAMYDPSEEIEVFAIIMENDREIIDLSGPYFTPEVKPEGAEEGEDLTQPLPVLAAFQLAFRPHPFEVEMALSGEDLFDEALMDEIM